MEQNYSEQQEEIRFSDYIKIVYHYRLLITCVFLLIFAITAVYTLKSPKIYQATAKVLLEDKGKQDLLFLANQGVNATTINNNMEIMKSRPVLGLAYQLVLKHKDSDTFPMVLSGAPISNMQAKLKVESKRETDLLAISYESTNPQEAMTTVNSVSEALQQQNTQYARLEFTTIREFLENQLDALSRRLQTSEEDLRAYKIENSMTELSEETKSLIEKSADAQALYEEAVTNSAIASKTYMYLKNQLVKQDSLISNVNNILATPYIDELRKNIVETQATIARLVSKNGYTMDHPQIKQLSDETDNLRGKLIAEISRVSAVKSGSSDPLEYRSDLIQKIAVAQIDMSVAVAKVEAMKSSVDNYNQRMTTLPDKELELARLTRNLAIDEKIHGIMVEKYEDAKVAEQAKMGNVRIIERAELPSIPIKPKTTMNMIIGLLLGLTVGIASAFIVHSMDTKIRTVEDLEALVKLPLVGTIPFINESSSGYEMLANIAGDAPDENQKEIEKSLQYVVAQLVTQYAPKSPISESYRTLRTNILAKKPQGPVTIMVTSSGPKEGKSTTISNLAIAFAQMNAKIVLVDFDMRRPMLQNKFAIEKETGSSDYLIDEDISVDNIIKQSGIPNLDLITSGFVPPNPAELLASSRVDQMLIDLKKRYDIVLIDTPPIIAVTDAMILAKKVDMLYLLIRIGQTEKGLVRRAREMMGNINASINGIIANGLVVQKYYSRYNNYYYYYYYYYGDNVPEKKRKNLPKILRKN